MQVNRILCDCVFFLQKSVFVVQSQVNILQNDLCYLQSIKEAKIDPKLLVFPIKVHLF